MRIAYCTNVRLPSERAHGHQVARVCDALIKLGHEVEIFAPYRKNPIQNDYWSFHRANKAVKLTYLGTFDPIDSFVPKFFQLPLLNWQLKKALRNKLQMQEFAVAYTRSPALLPTLLETGAPVLLELHTLPNKGRTKFVHQCNACALIVCLTTPMRDELISLGVDQAKITVEPDAFDLSAFSGVLTSVSPTKYSRFTDPAIGYAGQLSSMGLPKGIDELLGAIKILRGQGRKVQLLIAGPEPKDQALLQNLQKTEGVTYCGFLPHGAVPDFLSSCTVLAYPAPASDHPFFQRDTSPLKIFEYMASKKPIVAADLPPLRDIVSEEIAFLCRPGDPQSLADAIARALDHPEEAKLKADRAWQKVQNFTWEKRMARIMGIL